VSEEYIEEIEEEDIEEMSVEQELYEHFRFVVDKGQALVRIDKYLVNCMASTSRNRIQEAADAGNICVNDKPVKSNYRVKPFDIITIFLAYPPSQFEIIPQDIPINIVYEDDDIILVNKQPGLVVHPGFGNFDGTLLNAIAFHMKDHPEFDPNDSRIGLVHRIDKDTSGLLLIAKTEEDQNTIWENSFSKNHTKTLSCVSLGKCKRK